MQTRLLLAALGLGVATAAQAVTVDCVVEPAQKVKVGSAATGLVSEVLANRGDKVEAGQVIARLDSSVEEANLAIARAQASSTENVEAQRTRVELYRKRVERSAKLAPGITTQEKLDQQDADFQVGQRDLQTELLKNRLAGLEQKRAEAMLGLRVIRSPIAGLVTEKLLAPGEFVRQETPVFTVVQLDPLYVEAYVPVAEWGRVTMGGTGTVRLEEPIGGEYEAKVTVVDHVFDAASGTFGIRLEMPNPKNALPAGQRCKVAFAPKLGGPVADALPQASPFKR
jgi:RND family efflux transporter MFP subunit